MDLPNYHEGCAEDTSSVNEPVAANNCTSQSLPEYEEEPGDEEFPPDYYMSMFDSGLPILDSGVSMPDSGVSVPDVGASGANSGQLVDSTDLPDYDGRSSRRSMATMFSGTSSSTEPTADSFSAATTGNEFVADIHNLEVVDDPHLKVMIDFDPETHKKEYKQSDIIRGRVIVQNTCDRDLPFDLLMVSLEGTRTTRGSKTNFLSMLEYNSSYGLSSVVTEEQKDGGFCKFTEGVVKAGETYFRPFYFQVPSFLLEDNCKHGIYSHIQLPPCWCSVATLGYSQVRICYHVVSRVIAKACYYSDTEDPKSVIIQQNLQPLLLVPSNQDTTFCRGVQFAILNNLERDIDRKILVLQRLHQVLGGRDTEGVAELAGSIEDDILISSKGSQLYCPRSHVWPPFTEPTDSDSTQPDKMIILNSKSIRNLFSQSKLQLSTPSRTYKIPYVDQSAHQMKIPITLTLINGSIPKLKSLRVQLVSLTLNSRLSIPVEFNHDMIFKNTNPRTEYEDDFRSNIINKFKKKQQTLKSLTKGLDADTCKVELEMLHSLNALASIRDKVVAIPLETAIEQDNQSISTPQWSMNQTSFTIALNLGNLQSPANIGAYGEFKLNPHFQTCHVSRFYYFQVHMQFGDHLFNVKLPIFIVN